MHEQADKGEKRHTDIQHTHKKRKAMEIDGDQARKDRRAKGRSKETGWNVVR